GRMPGDRDRAFFLLDAELAVDLANRIDHGGLVHDRAIDDGLGRDGLDAEVDEAVAAFASLLELHDLDRAGADVEADTIFCHPGSHLSGGAADGAAALLVFSEDHHSIARLEPERLQHLPLAVHP